MAKRSQGRKNSGLREFKCHLMRYVSMRNPRDNLVYVVSLSEETITEGYTWIDVFEKDKRYFHPVGDGRNRWPKEPPNYIAFRYHGKLQSVHYITGYDVLTDLSSVNKNWPQMDKDHFLYTLGPAMTPSGTIRSGRIQAARFWCIIDTLLSGAYTTIRDARDESNRRKEAINH